MKQHNVPQDLATSLRVSLLNAPFASPFVAGLLPSGSLERGLTIGAKFFFGEWLRVMPMCVQSQQHRRAFLHNAHACMTTSVNATLVPFW